MIVKKDKIIAKITILFNEMSITIASITMTRTIDSIQARYIELNLPYRVIKKVKGIKKARKRNIKKVKKGGMNARKGDAMVIASGNDALSTSH
jgi:hypothetical protein